MTGMWKTDAPLSPKRMDEVRPTLNSLWAALDGVVAYGEQEIVLDELTVYIYGVRWTYEDQRGLRDYGR
jgi:hypothetical protein